MKFCCVPWRSLRLRSIGEHFAWLEVSLALATIAQQWEPELAPNPKVTLQPLLTLQPRGGLPMTLRRRVNWV